MSSIENEEDDALPELKAPVAAIPLITALGFTYEVTNFGYLLKHPTIANIKAFVVDFESFFKLFEADTSLQKLDRHLYSILYEVFATTAKAGNETYLYVLSPEDQPAITHHLGNLPDIVERNTMLAPIRVVTLQELELCLAGPFKALAPELLAYRTPVLELLSALHMPFRDKSFEVVEPNARFGPRIPYTAAMAQDLIENPELFQLVCNVFRLVMGFSYVLQIEDDTLCIARKGQSLRPLEWTGSNSEKIMLQLAVFLARESLKPVPDTKIGLYDVVTSFDSLTRLAFIVVIRDLMVKQHTSLMVIAAPTDSRRHVRIKFSGLIPSHNIIEPD